MKEKKIEEKMQTTKAQRKKEMRQPSIDSRQRHARLGTEHDSVVPWCIGSIGV